MVFFFVSEFPTSTPNDCTRKSTNALRFLKISHQNQPNSKWSLGPHFSPRGPPGWSGPRHVRPSAPGPCWNTLLRAMQSCCAGRTGGCCGSAGDGKGLEGWWFSGKTIGKPWENNGKTIRRKTMGKQWENHRKTIGKSWENHRKAGWLKQQKSWYFNGIYSWFMLAKLVKITPIATVAPPWGAWPSSIRKLGNNNGYLQLCL